MILHLGETYFEKLKPGGIMEMAFLHKRHFDKKEIDVGLDVSARAEIQCIFKLKPNSELPPVAAILNLPGSATQENKNIIQPKEGHSYLFIISLRNRQLPALLPCAGKLNKAKTDIKTFYPFISGIQKEYNHLRNDGQTALNNTCHQLWQKIEKQNGYILHEDFIESTDGLAILIDEWKKIISLLQKQPLFILIISIPPVN